jgi:putative ABC transport system permease protein
MGISNCGILRMILLQALLIGGVGSGLGVGLCAVFFIATGNLTHLAGLHMTWAALAGIRVPAGL